MLDLSSASKANPLKVMRVFVGHEYRAYAAGTPSHASRAFITASFSFMLDHSQKQISWMFYV